MAIYFCFSDECGYHKSHMSEKELSRQPYYVRSTIMIKADEWKKLSANFKALKVQYGIPQDTEFKWCHLWMLSQQHFLEKDASLKFFSQIGKDKLMDFVKASIDLLSQLEYATIIITFTDNRIVSHSEEIILRFHFQDILRRIEMEVQSDPENLAILFVDPVNPEKNDLFRNMYHELISGNDFIKNYSHVKDSLNIEYSHHSVGIQLADFVSGVFNSFLRCNNINKYESSLDILFNHVSPLIRKYNNKAFGYGILEVPGNKDLRKSTHDKLFQLHSELYHPVNNG